MDISIHSCGAPISIHVMNTISLSWEEGKIVFDGYWYDSSNNLPCIVSMYEYSSGRGEIVEILTKTVGESTDRISEIEDDDGEIMNVCFFPTNIITLTFRIIPPKEDSKS